MATITNTSKSLIDVYNERPDVQSMVKGYEGDPFTSGTKANTALNDWWNSNGSKEYAGVSLVQPNQTSTFKVDVPTEIPSSLLSGQKTTEADIASLIESRNSLYSQLQNTPVESTETTDIKDQLADTQEKINNVELSKQAGINAAGQQVIAMEYITGQTQAIEQRALQQLNTLNATYDNLTTRLGMSQDLDKLRRTKITDLLTYNQDSLNIEFQIQSRIDKQISDLQSRIDSYNSEAKEQVQNILETYSQVGIDWNDLSDSDKQYLMQTSQRTGMPLSLYIQALATAKNKYLLDTANQTKNDAMDLQLKELEIQKSKADIAYTQKATANVGKTSSGSSFESPVEGITSQKQLTLFNSMIENGKSDLQRGISWGNVFNDIKKNFKGVPDQIIDSQLGTYWKQAGAYENYKSTQNSNSASYDPLDAAIAWAMKS